MEAIRKRRALERRLLNQSGDVAFVADSDYWIEKIHDEGRFFTGDDSVIEDGDAGRCHENSINNHMKNPELKVCTGFSMNNGRWIRHSWCVDSEGRVHECTPIKRELYYGTILDEENTILLRRDWDFAYDAECRKAELRKPILEAALREAKDCKYFIERCIKNDCLLDPEIEIRRKKDLEGEEWSDLKGHLYKFKENFFRSIGKSPFQVSLTDYKKEAQEYLERTYPFCFGIDLRSTQEMFYESGINLELEFYAMSLGATDEQLLKMKDALKEVKLQDIGEEKSVKRGSKIPPVKGKISLDLIKGSSVDAYRADNLYEALMKIDDKHVSNFIEFLILKDYEKNADTIFAGTCVDLDEAGNYYVSEGNHRVLTAKALRFVKEFITGKKIDKPLEFTGTISRIRVKNRSEESTGWEY